MFDILLTKKRISADRALLGKWGEKQALKFLKAKGHQLLTKNFSCERGEIDIITAEANGTIVFVEVKTRTSENFAMAEDAVNYEKQRKMSITSKFFLSEHNIRNRPYRFDIITVILPPEGKKQINHYANAFVR